MAGRLEGFSTPQWDQMNKAPLTSKGGPGSPLNSSLEEEERQGYDGLNESFLIVYTRELSIHDGWRQRGPPENRPGPCLPFDMSVFLLSACSVTLS